MKKTLLLLVFFTLWGAKAEAQSLYDTAVLADNPVVYWPLGTGGFSNLAPTTLSLTPFNSPTTSTLPNGDSASVFNGTTQYLEAPDNNILSVPTTGILTIEAWMRPDVLTFPVFTGSGYVHWMGKGSGSQSEWAARMYNATTTDTPPRPNRISGYSFNLSGGLGIGSYFQDTVTAGQWIHYTFVINTLNTSPTYPTGYTKIYKNGVLRDQDSLSDGPIVPGNGTDPVRIGTRDLVTYFEGAVGKVAIYNYELSANQINNHHTEMVDNFVFISQSGAGAQDGASCASAKPVSYFNNSANWSATPTGIQIGPDTTVHLCGTITGTLNGTLLTAQGSGTSGHPITILFESGAILQSPAFLKAIDISFRSYIVVDGGTNGIIQNTANGNNLANQQSPTYGVYARGCTPGCRTTNVNFLTFYVRTAGQAALGLLQTDVSPVFYLQAPGMRVDHNVMSNCGWCINGYGSSGVEIDHNTISKMDHGVAMGPDGSGTNGALIHDNSFGSMAEWDTPTNPCSFHHDGIHIFSDSGPNTNPQIYNNTFNGDMTDSGSCATAYIFMEGASGGAGISGAKIYNNTVVNGNTTVHGRDMIWMEGRGASSNNSVFNNYLYEGNGSTNGLGIFVRNETNFSAKNNVIGNSSYQGTTLAAGGVSNNVYIDTGSNSNFGWNGGQFQALSGWQAACSCDAGAAIGQVGTVNINTTTYVPGSGSIAINAGTNLTSLAIAALNSDKNASPRPSSGPWTAGALNPGNTPPTPGLTITPNTINFGSSAIGVGSATQTATVTSNGTATATLGTTVAAFSDPQFARTGGTCTPSQSLPVGSSCTVIAQFTPTSAGVKNATMIVGGNGGNATASTALTGTGTGGTSSMSVTPTTFDFGSLTVNTTSALHNFTATNTGTTTLTMSTAFFSFTGTNAADFARVSPGGADCVNGQQLAPGATCLISVAFTPGGVGARTGTLNFLSDLATASATLTGTGTAVSNPSILITPRPLAFANTNVGSSNSQVATVTNNGNVSLTISGVSKSGTNAADFVIDSTTCSGTLAISGTCTVNTSFHPTVAGAETANLTVTTTVTSNTDAMNGTGVAVLTPGIGLSPSSGVSFGSQIVGTTSSVQTVTVTSTGTGNLTLNTPYYTLSGTNAADVTNTGAGTCSSGQILAPGASCTITLTFNPAGAGARAATLNVAGTASGSLALSGAGIAAVVTLTAAPSPVPFGSVTQSTPSATQTVTITNTGNVAGTLATPYFTLTGTNAADWTNTATGTCANGASIAPTGTCTVKLTFTPATLGTESAILTVSTTGAVSVTDNLSGTGVAPSVPSIAIAPNPVAFGSVNVGSNTSLTVTISNNGTATLNFSTPFYSITGTNAGDWTRTGGTCSNGGTVATSASCTIILQFTPGAGLRSATLTINGNATKTAQLTGTGTPTAPVIALTPSPRDFGIVIQNTPSGAMTVTVTNSGTSAQAFQTPFYTITGTNAADFARTGGTCVDGASLAAAASCTVIMVFTPSTTAGETATLAIPGTPAYTLVSSATGSTMNYTLTGNPSGSWSLPVNPTPTTSGSIGFTVNPTGLILNGSSSPDFLAFYVPTSGRNFAACLAGNCFDITATGPQLYSGPSATPTMLAGTFALTATSGTTVASVTLNGVGQAQGVPPAPSPQLIISDLFPAPKITISGKNFLPTTKITIDGVAQATVCTATVCTANLSPTVLLQSGFGIIGHTIGIK